MYVCTLTELKYTLKLVSAIFYEIFILHQTIGLQKLWKMFFISSKKLFSFSRYSNFCISTFPSFSPCQPLLEHVRLVWDIYYAHAYLCHYDSALFCFQKLELRQFIFLINCRSNLTINIVKWGKKNEKQMINHAHTYQGKLYFWFQAFTWLVLCCWRSWSRRTWLKPRELEREYL